MVSLKKIFQHFEKISTMRKKSYLLTLFIMTALPQVAHPITIGNSLGADPYPAAVWIDVDGHGGSIATRDDDCTGCLIAPDLVVTAAHCFRDQIPPFTVTVGFGNNDANNIDSRFVSIHDNWAAFPFPPDGTPSDLALIRLELNASVEPLPLLFRNPRGNPQLGQGDVAAFAGYGDFHTPAKRWTGPPHDNPANPVKPWDIDVVDNEFTTKTIKQGEPITEGGDSGGPELIRRLGLDFVTSAHSTIEQITQSESEIQATRTDRQSQFSGGTSGTSNIDFILDEMPNPDSISIMHNLPPDPSLLAPDSDIGIFIEAIYPVDRDAYVFAPFLYEDDSFLFNDFDGDLALRPPFSLMIWPALASPRMCSKTTT